MRIAFLGFGLIGGSIARALREHGGWSAAAWTPTGAGPRRALGEGVLDAAPATPREALAGAGLVVLAAPPLACLDLLDELGGPLREALAADVVVTDVASTKGAIVARAAAHGLPFVGGHPMAGRETAGYAGADGGLFAGRPWVVVPADEVPPYGRLEGRVEALVAACGAVPVRMDADAHDRAVAAISHLPLVVSAALAEAVAGGPDWPAARELAASGWRDTTRLARGDVAMGAGIATTNAAAIAGQLRALRTVLDSWLADLQPDAGPDPERLAARLRAARERLGDAP